MNLNVRGLWVKFGPFLIDGSKIISKEQLTRERTQFGSQFARSCHNRKEYMVEFVVDVTYSFNMLHLFN